MPARRQQKPNILFFGIDSLRADHMSVTAIAGSPRRTWTASPRRRRCSSRHYSAHIPTTSGYAIDAHRAWMPSAPRSWRLRHKGPLRTEVKTLAEMLRDEGYNTTCVGFSGNPASRGFDKYIDYPGWGCWAKAAAPRRRT